MLVQREHRVLGEFVVRFEVGENRIQIVRPGKLIRREAKLISVHSEGELRSREHLLQGLVSDLCQLAFCLTHALSDVLEGQVREHNSFFWLVAKLANTPIRLGNVLVRARHFQSLGGKQRVRPVGVGIG